MWLLFILLQFSPSVLNAACPCSEKNDANSSQSTEWSTMFASEGADLSNQGRFEEALKKFKRALKVDPENASLCLNLGLVYQELKNYKNALLFLEKAAVLDPRSARAWYSLALLYEAVAVSPGIIGLKPDMDTSEFRKKAMSAWAKVIELEDDASKRETAKKHIERIKVRIER